MAAMSKVGLVKTICPSASAIILAGAILLGLSAIPETLSRSYALLVHIYMTWRRKQANRSAHHALVGQHTLFGGEATGTFRARNLAQGAPVEGEILFYGEQSTRRGSVVVGSPGSAKTRSKIYPDFFWGLQSSAEAGALVFVVKRRATNDCFAIASRFRTRDKIHVVGVGRNREHIDIMTGLSHESIGEAIQDGLGNAQSDFWRFAPAALVESIAELVMAIQPATITVPAVVDKNGDTELGEDAYELEIKSTLPAILALLTLDSRRMDAVFDYGFDRAIELEREDTKKGAALRRLLLTIRERILPLVKRDAKLAEELRQSVLPQLQAFSKDAICESFCDPEGIDLKLLEEGHVILLEIDETEHPRAVGTVVRMIFRRLEQIARERTAANRVTTLNPIIIICDEYGNYAAPGHTKMWNTVRESNFCPTVGITSISALAKQLGGDQQTASAIVSNFSNKFFFESDDKQTRELVRELVGKSIVLRKSRTEGSSRSRGHSSNLSAISGSSSQRSVGTSSGNSFSEQLDEVVDGSIWRLLGADRDHARAIAIVRSPSGVKTDVVTFGVVDPISEIYTGAPECYGLTATRKTSHRFETVQTSASNHERTSYIHEKR
jgi:hypothetical protein